MIKIYNTMTRKKEDFRPITPGKVKMYVCGPTVYNLIHIGNARPMIVFDTVRRYFLYKGYEVNYVSNFTDVDDKIIKEANKEGKTTEEVTRHYIAECRTDMAGMNILPYTHNPKATEEIDGMIKMISTLIDKGYAYDDGEGTVYYRTRKFKGYGKLSHKKIDDLEAGHREIKVTGDKKEDPLDFVLWKPKKEGEPSWKSPWGEGRPGWHIECSVMAKKYLGPTIDIHAGGEDLIFPHHENEIAQSEAANGVPFANYWMHNAFLRIDNQKMSKSLGNFFTVREISDQVDLQVLRFFILSCHYRNPLNFSKDLLLSAKSSLDRILTASSRLNALIAHADETGLSSDEQSLLQEAMTYKAAFEKAMDDDFNTPDAITAVFDFVKMLNTKTNEDNSKEALMALHDELKRLADVLGLIIDRKVESLDDRVESLIQEREEARKARDYKRADEIRDQLLSEGIELKDTREGVQWKRI